MKRATMRDDFQDSPARRRPWTVCSSARAGRTGLFLVLSSMIRLHAAEDQANPTTAEAAVEVATAAQPVPAVPATKKDGNEWVVAPIPTLDPSQGLGVMVVGQYIFKSPDQAAGTPSSILAVGGMYTAQHSWGAFGGYMGHWQDDLWRPVVGGGHVDVNYDYYGNGNQLAEHDRSVPVSQQASFGMVQLQRRILPHLYAGLRVGLSATEVSSPGIDDPPLVLPPLSHDVTTTSGGLVAQWDSRDNQFFPTSGTQASFSAILNHGDDPYQVYKLEWNGYYGLGDRTVIAARVYLQATGGDAPFYALASFGAHNDLRGYKSGKYRDRDMFATQVEWRQKLGGRWGFVVFAGAGEVVPGFDELNASDLLFSAGAGLRFQLAKSHPVNFRLDWAYGDASALYLGVGEAF